MVYVQFARSGILIKIKAPIVQIGAIKFETDGTTIDTFMRTVKLSSLDRYDYASDYETIDWWFQREHEAIKSVFCISETVDIRVMLRDFFEWIERPSEYYFWSQIDFDYVGGD